MPEPAMSGASTARWSGGNTRKAVAGLAAAALLVTLAAATPATAQGEDPTFVATDDDGAPLGPVVAPAVDSPVVIDAETIPTAATTQVTTGVAIASVGATTTGVGIASVGATAAEPAGPVVPQDTNWAATPLGPSTTWNVSAQTGTFSWSYPLRVPPAPFGPEPDLALTYNSASVDGRVASTNNQTSWIGEGWDLTPGFIERSYLPCSSEGEDDPNDPTDGTNDLCWARDNATLVFGGSGGPLVKVGTTNTWRLQADDGTRIEHLTDGFNASTAKDYWKLTTQDGTQYFFGRGQRSATDTTPLNSAWTVPVFGNDTGEPCHSAAGFASSWCAMVWRWNLEYVVDTSGNTMTYFYATETNHYRINNSSDHIEPYTRGGYLTKIDYGQVQGQEQSSAAPVHADFTVAERCLGTDCTTLDETTEPDVPHDLICSSASCPTLSYPAFFTRKRLVRITTSVRGAGGDHYSATGDSAVDTWSLTHEFKDPFDNSTPRPNILWLAGITHTGNGGDRGGSEGLDGGTVHFTGTALANRVDVIHDGRSPMNRYRLVGIENESGGTVSVNYLPAECSSTAKPASPATNTMRCFPVNWTPEGSTAPVQEYFHKYVVSSVVANGGAESDATVTSYTYGGSPAWHFDDTSLLPESERTWDQFRGYGTVEVTTGAAGADQLNTQYEYFRGMHGDRTTADGSTTRSVWIGGYADVNRANGLVYRTTVFDGDQIVSQELNSPWVSAATASDGVLTANLLGVYKHETTTYGSDLPGGQRTTRVLTLYDSTYGLPTRIDDRGEYSDVDDNTGDDLCTRINYVRNATAYIVNTVKDTETVSVNCDITPTRPDDVVSASRYMYDYKSYSQAPDKGLLTGTRQLASYAGSTAEYAPAVSTDYDLRGRVKAVRDQLGRETTTEYHATASGLVDQFTTTSPDPDGSGPLDAHTSVARIDPAWGTTVEVTDANGKTASVTLDALGRTTQVWHTDRATNQSPSITYSYSSDLTAVTTKTLTASGSYTTAVAINDKLGRTRQTQTESKSAEHPGRVITDTVYDSRGLVTYTGDGWFTTGTPQTAIITPTSAVPAHTT
ncbi:MAG: hypothetical protein KQH57_10990, partial [Actinomycetales bacterium]|nr:hypothetical protein [Actinomycetales bacterium]